MIEIIEKQPAVDDFLKLRVVAGLSPRSREAAERGLPHSLYAVTAVSADKTVGMGRVIGDGGCNYEIVDIAVDPDYQGQGIGRQIMQSIMDFIHRDAPAGSFVSLIADEPAFYEKFGFQQAAGGSAAMYIRL